MEHNTENIIKLLTVIRDEMDAASIKASGTRDYYKSHAFGQIINLLSKKTYFDMVCKKYGVK